MVDPAPLVNNPPVIGTIRVQGTRPNEPPSFADLSENVQVSVTVTDAEADPATFTYNWSSPVGTFTGTGTSVTWIAPSTAASTPMNVDLTLEVIETYTPGRGQTAQNKVTATATVRVHDSVKEVTTIAQEFLRDFSDSDVSPSQVMRNFLPGCHGTEAELEEVEDNRRNFTILGWDIGPAITTVNFGGTCRFRNRRGDACSRIPMEWRSRARRNITNGQGAIVLRAGQIQEVEGVDQLTAVYDRPQQTWKLCDSDWDSGARALTDSSIKGLVP